MKETGLERVVSKVDDSTAKLESFDDEGITTVSPISEDRSNFILSDKDVDLIQSIASEHRLSYEMAVSAVLRDAMDLYHWHYNSIGNVRE